MRFITRSQRFGVLDHEGSGLSKYQAAMLCGISSYVLPPSCRPVRLARHARRDVVDPNVTAEDGADFDVRPLD